MISVLQLLQIFGMNLEEYILLSLSRLKGRYSKPMKASKNYIMSSSILLNTTDCKNQNGA